MIDKIPTERVARLRSAYLNGPMQTQKALNYNLCGRQRYLFTKGWKDIGASNSLLRRSRAYAYVLEHMHPVILDDELIVGQPDYAPLQDEELQEWEALRPYAGMIPRDGGRTDHKSLDFEKLIKVGVQGLLDEIDAALSKLDLNLKEDIEKYNFYHCAKTELNALLVLADHYREHALTLAETADEVRKAELLELAQILSRVPRYPAGTFREALQSIHFYTFCLWGLYQCGHPDRYLLPYYENDLKSGRLTEAQAQELIDCFCLMYSTYVNSSSSIGFMIGGRDENGKAVENALTRHFLVSIAHTQTADPSIGLCVTDETSPALLEYAAALLAEGYSHPAIYNDRVITEALMAYGVNERDAHCYIHSCCVEITLDKKSDVWVVSPYHNTLQYLLDVLKQNEDCPDFAALLSAYAAYLKTQISERNLDQNLWQLERSHNAGEPVLVSCLVDDCLKRGKGIHDGGAVCNWTQPNFLGIANTVDALLAIDRYVFREKQLTIKQWNRILEANYEGHEALLQTLQNKAPHFGVGDDAADRMYKTVAEMIREGCRGLYNYRGDILIPAAFSYNEHIRYGSRTTASPDGRRAGEPLADGSNPVQGHDSKGPTAMIRSVTAWEQKYFLGGIATNLKISKNGNASKNREVLQALIKAFLAQDGVELQVNALDTEELKDAMVNPGQHRDLLVRIGGYSDYFVTLSKQLQEEILSRTEQGL